MPRQIEQARAGCPDTAEKITSLGANSYRLEIDLLSVEVFARSSPRSQDVKARGTNPCTAVATGVARNTGGVGLKPSDRYIHGCFSRSHHEHSRLPRNRSALTRNARPRESRVPRPAVLRGRRENNPSTTSADHKKPLPNPSSEPYLKERVYLSRRASRGETNKRVSCSPFLPPSTEKKPHLPLFQERIQLSGRPSQDREARESRAPRRLTCGRSCGAPATPRPGPRSWPAPTLRRALASRGGGVGRIRLDFSALRKQAAKREELVNRLWHQMRHLLAGWPASTVRAWAARRSWTFRA